MHQAGSHLDRTVEILATDYFEDGSVPRRDIAAAVDGACGEVSLE